MARRTKKNERTLVEEAKNDPQAFSFLYNLYFRRIYSYVSWRVGNRQDIEDLVSEIFTRALDKLDTFIWRKNATFSSWIFRIANNAVIDYYRAKDKEKHVDIDDMPEIESNELLPNALFERRRLFKAMFEEMQKLPPRQAEIITMRFFGEMRNKEIAKVLEIEEKSVSSGLFRGLKKLHAALHRSVCIPANLKDYIRSVQDNQ
jgi:RNA polymerase sigma-70 factor (ECF subfamily)